MEEQEQQNTVNKKQKVQMEPAPLSEPPSHKKLIIGIAAVFVLVVGGSISEYFLFRPHIQQFIDSLPFFGENNVYLIEEKEQAKSNPVSIIYLVNHHNSIDSESLKNVAEEIESELKVPVRIEEIVYANSLNIDSYYNQKKGQYDGDALWNYYARFFIAPENNARTIHIIDVDLFTKLSIFRPYILSRVLPNEEHILISVYRLKNESEDLYRLRLKKLALYNLGKSVALGIYSPHKNDSECLTSSVKTVEDLDALNESFCQNTQPLLSEVFKAFEETSTKFIEPQTSVDTSDDVIEIGSRDIPFGKATYWKTSDTVFFINVYESGNESSAIKIDNADALSFELLEGSYYSKDRNAVYYKGKELLDADPKTFEVIEPTYYNYGKDKNVVYYYDNIINGADPNTLEILSPTFGPFVKDKNNVYLYENIFQNVHVSSFQPLQCLNERIVPPTIFRSTFATDNDTVYTVIAREVTPFLSADKATFGVSDSCFGFDQNNIYDTDGNVLNVDRESFEFLSWGYAKDKNNVYDLWFGPLDKVSDLIILKDDPNTFIPSERKRKFLLQGL